MDAVKNVGGSAQEHTEEQKKHMYDQLPEEKKQKQKGKRQNPFENNNKGRKGRGKGKTKQDKQWNKYFNEFQEVLKPKGIYMRDVEGDGNCQFRSIADQLDGDENCHTKYREMAVEYITKNKEYFALFLPDDEDIDEYIKDMSESGTWGGHFELVALSCVLNVKFCLYMKDSDPVIIKSSEKDLKGVRIVHLAYHVDEHYSSIRKIGDDTQEPADEVPLPEGLSDSESDEEDSTEGSDKDVSQVTKEIEELHINDRNKKKNKKEKEEEEKGKGKNQKNNKKKEGRQAKRENITDHSITRGRKKGKGGIYKK